MQEKAPLFLLKTQAFIQLFATANCQFLHYKFVYPACFQIVCKSIQLLLSATVMFCTNFTSKQKLSKQSPTFAGPLCSSPERNSISRKDQHVMSA
jgi:hypothetical protein